MLSLKSLDISYNSLGSETGIVLGCELIDNKSLHNLNLTSCELDALSLISICQGVIESTTLKDVILDYNPAGKINFS